MAKEADRYTSMGMVLKRLRKEKGLTLEELAERADVSISYLHHIEHGTRKAPLSTLESLAQILGINLYELLGPSSAVVSHEKPSTYDAKIKGMLKHLSEKEKKSLHGIMKQMHKKNF